MTGHTGQEEQLGMAFGPFNRRESPTQTRETARLQTLSGEIWGCASRPGGGDPCVKAYNGTLAANFRGIEFTTPIEPDPGSSSPFEVRWYFPWTRGVVHRNVEGTDYAVIEAAVSNRQT